MLLCASIKKVLNHSTAIKNKLINTNGLHIKEPDGYTMYATLLMIIREQMRLDNNQPTSIIISDYSNPVSHLYGNVTDMYLDCYFIPSSLMSVPESFPGLLRVDLDRCTVELLLEVN